MTNTDISQPTKAPIRPTISRQVLVAFVLFALTAISFSVVAYQVRLGATLPFDRGTLWWIHDHVPACIGNLVVAVTNIGGPTGTVILAGGTTALLWIKRRKYAAVVLAATVGGAAVLNVILKYLFERTRPDLWTHLVQESSFSFPSGHAMASSALAFAVVVIFWRTNWRWWVVGVGIIYMVAIGFTRLYLGVHYPTDIIGGWIVSAGWVTVVTILISSYIDRRKSRLNNTA